MRYLHSTHLSKIGVWWDCCDREAGGGPPLETLSGEALTEWCKDGAFVALTDHTSAKACAQIRRSVEFLTANGPLTSQPISCRDISDQDRNH